MSTITEAQSTKALTLPAVGLRPMAFQALLVGVAVALPVVSHWLQLPVIALLPMHWTVFLAGLVYGGIGGGLTGLLAPLASAALTGMPMGIYLPLMVAELAVYGAVTGILRGKLRWNAMASVATAGVAGRVVYLAIAFALGTAITGEYLQANFAPGLIALALQVVALPLVARAWVKAGQH